jgi:cytochrome c5
MSRVARRSLGSVCLAALFAAACSSPPRSTQAPVTADGPVARDAGFLNDWRPGGNAEEHKRAWYVTPQGSQLIDFDVFLSIARPVDATPFAARESLERYGFVYHDLGVRQAGLPADIDFPIGMVKDTRGEGDLPLAKHSKELTKDFVGLTCAACHTGQVKYNGERFLVHGGPANLDFEAFMDDLAQAVARTSNDPAGSRYLERMAGRGAGEVVARERLAAAKARLDGLQARGKVPAGREAGPGRLDAMSHIMNEVFGDQFGDPNSIKPVSVPVSLPQVWNAARLQCVQTNCLTNNPLTRNAGEVLGVFGDSETYRDDSQRLRVRSTIKFENLYATEEALDWVESPKWSPKLPAPAADLVATGKTAFITHCQGCHAQPYLEQFKAQWKTNHENWDGRTENGKPAQTLADHFEEERSAAGKTRQVWRVKTLEVDEVGTDDQFIAVHAGRYTVNAAATQILDDKVRDVILATLRAKEPGAMQALAAKIAELEGRNLTRSMQKLIDVAFRRQRSAQSTNANQLRRPDGSVMSLALLGAVTASATDSFFLKTYPDIAIAAQQREKFGFFRQRPEKSATTESMSVYRARPLNGIAFTAPFGHNGTWPTLESVLFDEKRPESFWIGHSEFDPAAVGLDLVKGDAICGGANPPRMCFKMMTTEHQRGVADSGNSRSGHAGERFYGGRQPSATEKRAILEYLKSI